MTMPNFPYWSFIRLLILFCSLFFAVFTVLYAFISLLTLPEVENVYDLTIIRRKFEHEEPLLFSTDTIQSFRSRINKEWYYKNKLKELSEEQIKHLSETFHRNITIQWSQRKLLPPSKPLFDIMCFDFIENKYDMTVSIVITYHNELPILLMRTLTTIKHRTLPRYLKEVVLTDDNSSINITAEITEYAKDQDIPLVYLHNEEQLGIANSRRKGIFAATGDVAVLLDSHMEVNDGWLEPLLHTLQTKPRALAIPLIHMSDEQKYAAHDGVLASPYYIKMQKAFGVFDILPTKGSETGRRWESYPSSSLLGGGIAGYKEVLETLYPEGVMGNGWGVENNRLAFRAWMCGEGVWMSPCSQILHPNGNDGLLLRYFPNATVFHHLMGESLSEAINFVKENDDKNKLVLKFTNDPKFAETIKKNSIRIKSTFDPEAHKCKDYSYYIHEVYEGYMSWERDEFTIVGEIQSVAIPDLCLEAINFRIVPYLCREGTTTVNDGHTMGFTKNHHIRVGSNDKFCWDGPGSADKTVIIAYSCHVHSATEGNPFASQHFEYNKETLRVIHVPTNRCLEIANRETAWLVKCDLERKEQEWNIKMSAWF